MTQGRVDSAQPEFERRWRAVGFRVAGIGGNIRRDLEGRADNRVIRPKEFVPLR